MQVTFVCLFESEARTHALKKDEVGRPSAAAAAAPDGPNRRDGGEEELLTDLKLECLMAGRPDGEAAPHSPQMIPARYKLPHPVSFHCAEKRSWECSKISLRLKMNWKIGL